MGHFSLQELPILFETPLPVAPALPMSTPTCFQCFAPHRAPLHPPFRLPCGMHRASPHRRLWGHQRVIEFRSHPKSAVVEIRSPCRFLHGCVLWGIRFYLVVRTTKPGVHFPAGSSGPALEALGRDPGPIQRLPGAGVTAARHWVPVAFTHGVARLHYHGKRLSPYSEGSSYFKSR